MLRLLSLFAPPARVKYLEHYSVWKFLSGWTCRKPRVSGKSLRAAYKRRTGWPQLLTFSALSLLQLSLSPQKDLWTLLSLQKNGPDTENLCSSAGCYCGRLHSALCRWVQKNNKKPSIKVDASQWKQDAAAFLPSYCTTAFSCSWMLRVVWRSHLADGKTVWNFSLQLTKSANAACVRTQSSSSKATFRISNSTKRDLAATKESWCKLK